MEEFDQNDIENIPGQDLIEEEDLIGKGALSDNLDFSDEDVDLEDLPL